MCYGPATELFCTLSKSPLVLGHIPCWPVSARPCHASALFHTALKSRFALTLHLISVGFLDLDWYLFYRKRPNDIQFWLFWLFDCRCEHWAVKNCLVLGFFLLGHLPPPGSRWDVSSFHHHDLPKICCRIHLEGSSNIYTNVTQEGVWPWQS